MKGAEPRVATGRLGLPADKVPAGRQAATISAGIGAAVVLAGVAPTFLARCLQERRSTAS